jgi:hypothetical protein
MRKWIGILLGAVAVVLFMLTISCKPAANNVNSYAEDRAAIEDLQARYLFALDFFDMDTYVSTLPRPMRPERRLLSATIGMAPPPVSFSRARYLNFWATSSLHGPEARLQTIFPFNLSKGST